MIDKPLLAVIGCAVAAVVVVVGRVEPVAVDEGPPPVAFEQAWQDAVVPLALLAGPRVVKTERLTVEPPVVVEDDSVNVETAEMVPVPVGRPVWSRPRKSTVMKDICRGKGKKYTANGKSWRCRR